MQEFLVWLCAKCVAFELQTPRGLYRMALAKEPETVPGGVLLTLSLERLDGIEKVAFQCRIDITSVKVSKIEDILAGLARWIERDFEMTRENALKSIRSERKLMVMVLDEEHRGPF